MVGWIVPFTDGTFLKKVEMITDINITTSEEEIIGLELAKLHLRVDSDYTEEDVLINLAISSARTEAENYIERKLLDRKSVV